MRTLLMTQVAPNPPDAGPKVKTHYTLRTLAKEHQVELLTFARSDEEVEAAQALGEWCEQVTTIPLHRRKSREPYYAARGWLTGTPFLVARDAREEYARTVQDRVASGEVDVLHADQLPMAQYLALANGNARTVFDAHNAVWDLVYSLRHRQPTPVHRGAAQVEWRMLRRFEGRVCRASDLTLVVSEHDRDALTVAAGAPLRSEIIPIGVEVKSQSTVIVRPDARRLLSVATMHYPPNVEAMRWFRDTVWPLVRVLHPDLELDIVGIRPPEDIVQWSREDSRVHVHGYVADLEPLYQQAAAFIVPLQAGSGVRVKILEAMARGVPVVSTSIGADSLELSHGEHMLIADEPEAFARAIGDLVQSFELRSNLARAARQRVLARYDWRSCCRPMLDAYRRLEQGGHGSPEQTLMVKSGLQ